MIGYATASELSTFDPDLDHPVDVRLWLEEASMLVASATVCDVYAMANGLPTDLVKLAAMRDATCAQVQDWVHTGIDPTRRGMGDGSTTANVTTRTVGPRSTTVEYATDPGRTPAAVAAATERLCLKGYRILRAAGLARSAVAG